MLSERPWKIDLVLNLIAWLMIGLFVGTSLNLLVGRLLPGLAEADLKFMHFVTSTIFFHGLLLGLTGYLLKFHEMSWREFLGLTSPRLVRVVLLAVAAAALVTPAALALNKLSAWLITLLNQSPQEQAIIQVLNQSVGLGQRIASGVAAIVIAPLAEEVLFRGILYPLIKQRGYPMLALAGTSLLFALVHWNLMTFVPLTFFAVAMVLLFEATDSLLAPILAHSLFNGVNYTMLIMTSS